MAQACDLSGYLYDADGTRVAKGSITVWSCDPTQNGFHTTNDYVLGLGGEQVTEMGVGDASSANSASPASSSNSALTWQHTNVYAGGKLLGTYDSGCASNIAGLHFYFDDPLPGSPATRGPRRATFARWGGLGTRRAQTDYAGVLEQSCVSLPFGDALSCAAQPGTTYSASLIAPTEQHFTGKERDTESGNDYFEARYYSSSMGRFMSPDWSAKEEPIPYAKLDDPQTLNLYAYVGNNPLVREDADGHGLLPVNLQPHLDVSQFTSVHEQLSDKGADFIGKGFENPKNEGFNKKTGLYYSYDDGYGYPTIGYGHKIGPKEDFSKGLTHDQVVALFKKDATIQVNAVKKWVPFRLPQQEVDALVSLHFNVGPNANLAPERAIMSGEPVTNPDFTRYNTVHHIHNYGLTVRRIHEFNMFDRGIYNADH